MRVVLYWETRRTILLLLRRLTRYRTSDSLLWEPARPELAGAAFVPNLQVSVRAQRGEVFRWSLAFTPDARLLHGVVLRGGFCDEGVPFLAVHRVPVVDQEFAAGQLDRARAVGRLVEYGASVGYFGRLKLGRCVPVQLDYSVCPSSTSNNWPGKTALSVIKDGFAVFPLLRGKILQVLHVVSMLVKVVSVQTPLLLKVLLQLILHVLELLIESRDVPVQVAPRVQVVHVPGKGEQTWEEEQKGTEHGD